MPASYTEGWLFPLCMELGWPQQWSAPQLPDGQAAQLLSRTLSLSTEHPASLLDTTRRNANGLFVDSVTLPPATPLGYGQGTRGGHSGEQLPHRMALATEEEAAGPVPTGLFH